MNLKCIGYFKRVATYSNMHIFLCFQGKYGQVWVFLQEPGWHRRYLPGPHTQGWKESEGGILLASSGGCRHWKRAGKQVRLQLYAHQHTFYTQVIFLTIPILFFWHSIRLYSSFYAAGMSSTAMPSSLSLQKGMNSWPLSAPRPLRASPVKLEAWCLSSMRSSSSPVMRRERVQMPMFSSLYMAPMEIQAAGSYGRSFATFLNVSRLIVSWWKCWTWASCRKFG